MLMIKSKVMKRWSTTPVSKGLVTKSAIVATAVVMAISAPLSMMPQASADKYDDRINALQNEISQYQAEAGRLGRQANSLQAELARLNAEKATIQGQIKLTQAKHDKLKDQIKETEEKIADNKDALGITLADLYVDDTISPLEMLASSDNIGDYVDKQTYRTAMSEQLNKTIKEIDSLKRELEKQKKAVDRVLADQKAQHEALAAKESERQRVLSVTKGKEANFKKLAQERQQQVEEQKRLQQEEVARRLAATGGGGAGFSVLPGSSANGGYPAIWANAPQDSMVDNWGMYNRQCTSYAAFRVHQAYGNMPYWGGRGNAHQWDDNARAAGIPVGSTPKPGSVGVLHDGGYGHVAWVDQVHSDGTITIDHYNINWSGQYARWRVSAAFFDTYIYFGQW